MTTYEKVPINVIQNMRDHAHAHLREWQQAAQDADAAVARATWMLEYWGNEATELEAAYEEKTKDVWS